MSRALVAEYGFSRFDDPISGLCLTWTYVYLSVATHKIGLQCLRLQLSHAFSHITK